MLVLVSDKQARVLATPSHSCLSKLQITDVSFVVRAEVISLKGRRAEIISLKVRWRDGNGRGGAVEDC